MREIKSNEIPRLRECLVVLSEYHNTVSTHFKGMFPSRPYGFRLGAMMMVSILAEK